MTDAGKKESPLPRIKKLFYRLHPATFWKICLTIAVLLGLILRLQSFHILPIDGHAMRQTDTESVAYNFAFGNHNILYPQNSLIRPVTNGNAYFFFEFPAYEYSISLLYRIFGWHVELARIVNFALYTVSALSLFWFTKKISNSSGIAFFTAFFYVFAPGSIFFLGHAIHPDVFAICTYLVSLAAFLRWKEKRKARWLFISLFSLSLSVATRPFILIGLPAYLFLLWTMKSAYWEYLLYLFASPFIYGFWKIWQLGFNSADSSWENWVLDGRNGLFTYGVFVNQLLLKNVIGEVMGKVTSFFAGLGIVNYLFKRDKALRFVLVWLLFVPVYWLMVPNGNIIHQYYADVYIIPIAMLAGYGLWHLLRIIWLKNKFVCYGLAFLIVLLTAYNGYHTSRYYFLDTISNEQQQLAKEIGRVVPASAKIVYLAINNSIPFSLYHIKGWMLGYYPLDVDPTAESVLSMKSYGANYIVAGKVNDDLPQEEFNILVKSTDLIYSSKDIQVYKYR
jgi:hypothetical protein